MRNHPDDSLSPLAVGALALRRLAISRSFNRVIYGFTVLFSLYCLRLLWVTLGEAEIDRALAHGTAYTPVLLWAYVIYISPSTRGLRNYGDTGPVRQERDLDSHGNAGA